MSKKAVAEWKSEDQILEEFKLFRKDVVSAVGFLSEKLDSLITDLKDYKLHILHVSLTEDADFEGFWVEVSFNCDDKIACYNFLLSSDGKIKKEKWDYEEGCTGYTGCRVVKTDKECKKRALLSIKKYRSEVEDYKSVIKKEKEGKDILLDVFAKLTSAFTKSYIYLVERVQHEDGKNGSFGYDLISSSIVISMKSNGDIILVDTRKEEYSTCIHNYDGFCSLAEDDGKDEEDCVCKLLYNRRCANVEYLFDVFIRENKESFLFNYKLKKGAMWFKGKKDIDTVLDGLVRINDFMDLYS